MKLSEAMRLGAMLKPQGFGLFDVIRDELACALVAARLAIGLDKALLSEFPVLYEPVDKCPSCSLEYQFGLSQMVVHLNDDHRWTRERIADWIEANFERDAPTQETPQA